MNFKSLLFIGLFISLFLTTGCAKCIKSHKEVRHHGSWTSWMFVGKVMSPQFHPAYDAIENVCDEYEKTN